jgi:hypothetical protein
MKRLLPVLMSFTVLLLSSTEGWSADPDIKKPSQFSPESLIKSISDTAKGITDTAKKLGNEFVSPPESILEQKERAMDLINRFQDSTLEVIGLRKKEQNADNYSFTGFGTTKDDVREDILEILVDLQKLLFEGTTYDFIAQISNQEELIKESMNEISSLKEQQILSPEKGTTFSTGKDDLEKQIKSKLDEISSYKKNIRKIYQSIIKRYKTLGINLPLKTVKTLTKRIDGKDIIQNVEVFNAIKKLIPLLLELINTNKENLAFSKKYYGVHVLLSEVVVLTQNQYLQKNRGEYLPELDAILFEVEKELENIDEQSSMFDATRKKAYEKNKEANLLTKKTCLIYRRILVRQQERVEDAMKESRKDLKLAYSTYRTVDLSSTLLTFIKNSDKGFNAVMSMQIPEMVPFENEQMERKFSELTKIIQKNLQ